MNKKLLSVFLSIIIVFSMACTATADDAGLVSYSCIIDKFAGDGAQDSEKPQYDVYVPDKDSVREVISQALKDHADNVDLSAFEIPFYLHTSSQPVVDELCTLFTDLVNYTPEFYYVFGLYSFKGQNGYVLNMPLAYRLTEEETLETQHQIDLECIKILSEITPDMGDLEKALTVHDYFAIHYEYDYDARDNGYEFRPSAFSMDGLLIDKTAVCQGFSLAYKYVLGLLGIEAVFCPSNAMGHAWDLVKINGNWYHVDVTADSPTADRVGWASHQYFLLSDAEMQAEGYTGWAAEHEANDTTYANFFWRNILSGIFYRDGFWYYSTTNNEIIKRNVSTGEITTLLGSTGAGLWRYLVSSGNLRLFVYGDRIFYNGPKKIYSIDLNGNNKQEVYTPSEITADLTHILGIAKNGKNIIYIVYTYADGELGIDGINLFGYFDDQSENFFITASYYSDELTVRILNNPDMSQGRIFACVYDSDNNLVNILNPVQITDSSVYKLDFALPNISQGYIKIMAWDFFGSPLAKSINIKY